MRKSNKYLIKKGVRKKEKRKNNGGTSHETMEVFEEKINAKNHISMLPLCLSSKF